MTGRNKEPVTLPVKFPLLLAQGVEGIAVDWHQRFCRDNFNELIDASIRYLEGKDFELYPDSDGRKADVSKYN
ncbi:MAG: DNA gyrase subunit A [Bacteroidales bacterium]